MTVLGFVVQCGICPQQAVVAAQPGKGWVCPRCAEVAGGFGDVDVAQAEPIASDLIPLPLDSEQTVWVRGDFNGDITVRMGDGLLYHAVVRPDSLSVQTIPETIYPAWMASGPGSFTVSNGDVGMSPAEIARAEHVAAPRGIDLPAGMTYQQYVDAHRPPDSFVRLQSGIDDDEYPVGKVQG